MAGEAETRGTPAVALGPLVAALSAGNFAIGMGAFVVIGILGPLQQGLGIGPGTAGLLLTVYALAYAVLSPLLVAATGKLGRRTVLSGSLAAFALACLLSALAPSAALLFAARILAAASAGVFTPVAAAVVAAASPPERRGRLLARAFLGLTLAQVAGVPAGSLVGYELGWRAGIGMVALVALPCLLVLLRAVPAALPFEPTRLGTLAAQMADWRGLLSIGFTASFLGAIFVVYTYLAELLEATMGFGGRGVSAALVLFGAGAVAGNLLGGALADRLGPARTLRLLALAQIPLLAAFSLLPLPVAAVVPLVLVWSVAGWSFMPSQQLRLLAWAGPAQTVVLALNAAAIYVGAAFGSALGGAAIETAGVGALGLAAAGLAALSLLHLAAGDRATATR